MNLCVDQGNNHIHAAIFKGDVCVGNARFSLDDTQSLTQLLAEQGNDEETLNVILSSVSNAAPLLYDLLQSLNPERIMKLTSGMPLPIKVHYQKKRSLGADRVAAAVGAYKIAPMRNCLIIDAGTAITYDVLTAQGDYLGGSIAPGLEMRLKMLNANTAHLPLVEKEGDAPLIGHDTETAIRSGVVNGMLFEITGHQCALARLYPNLLTFLTGGDGFYFEKRLKSEIFAPQNADVSFQTKDIVVKSDLVLVGLNAILNWNLGV